MTTASAAIPAEVEALAMVANHDCERGIEDCRHHCSRLDAVLERNVQHWASWTPRPGTDGTLVLRDIIKNLVPTLKARATLRRWEGALKRYGAPVDSDGEETPEAGPEPPPPTLGSEVAALVVKARGPESARRLLAHLVADLDSDIAMRQEEARRQIDPFRLSTKRGGAWLGQNHDVTSWCESLVNHFGPLLAQHRDASERLQKLRSASDPARLAKAVGSAVTEAVKAAGGRNAVIRGAREARIMAHTWLELDPHYGNLVGLKKELSDCREELERLGVPERAEPNSHAASLLARVASLKPQIAALAEEIELRRKAILSRTVDDAMSGDETARAELSRLASSLKTAFADEFPAAIQSAALAGSSFDAVVDEVCREIDQEAAQYADAARYNVVRRVRVPVSAGASPAQ
jgi:hypothetical protein